MNRLEIHAQNEDIEVASPFTRSNTERKRQLSVIDEINDENMAFEDSNEVQRESTMQENVYDSSHVTQQVYTSHVTQFMVDAQGEINQKIPCDFKLRI